MDHYHQMLCCLCYKMRENLQEKMLHQHILDETAQGLGHKKCVQEKFVLLLEIIPQILL